MAKMIVGGEHIDARDGAVAEVAHGIVAGDAHAGPPGGHVRHAVWATARTRGRWGRPAASTVSCRMRFTSPLLLLLLLLLNCKAVLRSY